MYNSDIDQNIEALKRTMIDLLKETLEFETGESLGITNNKIKYKNYLIDNPIVFYEDNEDDQDGNGDFIKGSKFVDYMGPIDGSIGSKEFPQGKGKCLDPKGQYYPFYTFGFGASPKSRPTKAFSIRSGVDCCKLAINTVLSYLNQGCKTIGDVICKYHTGIATYDEFLKYYNARAGIRDIADGRFVSSTEMISRQNYYQQHLVDYTHMSGRIPTKAMFVWHSS